MAEDCSHICTMNHDEKLIASAEENAEETMSQVSQVIFIHIVLTQIVSRKINYYWHCCGFTAALRKYYYRAKVVLIIPALSLILVGDDRGDFRCSNSVSYPFTKPVRMSQSAFQPMMPLGKWFCCTTPTVLSTLSGRRVHVKRVEEKQGFVGSSWI